MSRFIPWYRGTDAARQLRAAFADLDDAQAEGADGFTAKLLAGLRSLHVPEPSPEAVTALEGAYDTLAGG